MWSFRDIVRNASFFNTSFSPCCPGRRRQSLVLQNRDDIGFALRPILLPQVRFRLYPLGAWKICSSIHLLLTGSSGVYKSPSEDTSVDHLTTIGLRNQVE
ncbi:hypothetical protein V6N12_031552 [Hibiscus sabdariffa]|uniref:Uncharacterized protein n=1 Tax=Hibiscus sabdariffa TaxID=183260 RepID=A0ABR2CRB9_9ROSI